MWRTVETIAKAVDSAISSAPSLTAYDKKWQSACLSAVIATIERLTGPSGLSDSPLTTTTPLPKAGKTDLPWNTAAKGKGKDPSPDSGRANPAPSSRAPSPTSPPPTYVNMVSQTTT